MQIYKRLCDNYSMFILARIVSLSLDIDTVLKNNAK